MDFLNEHIQEGAKFELVKYGENGRKERYISRFISKNSDFLVIAPPQHGGKTYELTPNESVELYIYTPQGVYRVTCTVLKYAVNAWIISLPTDIRHSQRREFLRVDKQCRANIQIHKPNGTSVSLSTLTLNLCGGGIGILLDFPIGEYSKINVELLLDELTINTLAEVVYTKPTNTLNGLKYTVALMFISVASKETDAIVKECLLFQLQEKNRLLKRQD